MSTTVERSAARTGRNPVPRTLFSGKGNAMIFHGGKMMRATWTKPAQGSSFKLATKAGPVKIPRGHVWLELVPVKGSGGDVTFH